MQMLHTYFPKYFLFKKTKQPSTDENNLVTVRLLTRLIMIYYFLDMNKTFYLALLALNKAEHLSPSSELAYIYAYMGAVWVTFPWFSRAFRDMEKGLKVAKDLGDQKERGVAYCYLTYCSYFLNKPQQALDNASEAISLLKQLGEYWNLSVGYCFRIHANWIIGRIAIGKEQAEEFVRVTKEVKTEQCLGWALSVLARTKSLIGDFENIDTEVNQGLALAIKTNDKSNIVNFNFYIAYIHLRKRNYSEAIKYIEKAAELFPKYYNKGPWILDMFPGGAQIYLDTIINANNISSAQRKHYLSRARWFVFQSRKWSILYKYFRGWTYQVWGTYNWLSGRKRRAERLWDKGLHWLRTNKNNPGGDKYRIAYLLLEEAKFLLQENSSSKKAYGNLIKAKELFEAMGCVLDLQTTADLLAKIVPEGTVMDSRDALSQKRHFESLLNVSQAIGSVFNLDELLDKIMDYANKVTGAERGFLLLYSNQTSTSQVEVGNSLELKVSHGLEKEFQGQPFSYDEYKLSLELIKEIERTQEGKLIIVGDNKELKFEEELKSNQVKQILAVPLKTKDLLVGIIYLDNRLAGGTFGRDELELMKAFSVQAAISIENTRLVGNMVEQERLKQEIKLGRNIQLNLLPKKSPQVEGLKLSGLMLPAKEIGGDYYDYIVPSGKVIEEQAQGSVSGKVVEQEQKASDFTTIHFEHTATDKLAIAIGDVSGKGVGAGLIMATAKATLKVLSQQGLAPKEMLAQANTIIHEYTNGEKFMSMLYMEWDALNRKMRYSSAGHEHIIIYRSKAGSQIVDSSSEIVERTENQIDYKLQSTNSPCVEVITSGGIVLGMLPEIGRYLEDKELRLNAGDKVVLYTDGITEAHNEKEEMYELTRLTEAVKKHGHKSIDELAGAIKDEVYAFIGGAEQFDDITLVVMERI